MIYKSIPKARWLLGFSANDVYPAAIGGKEREIKLYVLVPVLYSMLAVRLYCGVYQKLASRKPGV